MNKKFAAFYLQMKKTSGSEKNSEKTLQGSEDNAARTILLTAKQPGLKSGSPFLYKALFEKIWEIKLRNCKDY